jgi:hypothetical protein
MWSLATGPTSGRNCSALTSRGWKPTTKSSTASGHHLGRQVRTLRKQPVQ